MASFLGSLEVAQIYLSGWVSVWVAGWVGLTVIIELVSVQIGLYWNWSTGTELGNTIHVYIGKGMIVLVTKN